MNILEFDNEHDLVKQRQQDLVRRYLTSNGWKYTSRHPGSIWLWTHETVKGYEESDDDGAVTHHVHGETYAVEETVALQIQRYWELEAQHFNTHADDCPIFTTFDWDDCNCMQEDPGA